MKMGDRYNIYVKHAVTNEWTVVYWHDTDLMRTYNTYNIVKNCGLPCKLVREEHPNDVIMHEHNIKEVDE
jgi:hypothetical protein